MTQTPLSRGNARVKAARKLAQRAERADERLFLADGPNAVREALALEQCVVEVFATRSALAAYAELTALTGAADCVWTLVEDNAITALSDSVQPAGLVAVCRFIDRPLSVTISDATLVGICADIRDPGNAGAVLRACDAAGVDGVIFAGHSVDPYNPKTVRASAGSLFHVPLTINVDPADAILAAKAAGFTVLAADGGGELDLDGVGPLLCGPTAWLFGNEAWGLPSELTELADHRVRIPIYGRAESLNLSTAAALCVYESARIRRRKGETKAGVSHD